jgi:hypothetical protein
MKADRRQSQGYTVTARGPLPEDMSDRLAEWQSEAIRQAKESRTLQTSGGGIDEIPQGRLENSSHES